MHAHITHTQKFILFSLFQIIHTVLQFCLFFIYIMDIFQKSKYGTILLFQQLNSVACSVPCSLYIYTYTVHI